MEKREYTEEECEMCEGYHGGHEGCGGGCRHMHGMRCRHFLLRWVLGVLILAFVFGAGVKLGEFKERVWSNGYGMMDRGYGTPTTGYGMMRWNGSASQTDDQYRYGMMQVPRVNNPLVPTR